ncbi:tRNA N6-adenosine threonylcarbamoyltransferase [bacterium HR34]|nr:tRNA N6-adenosine threonylcarbamoyltransferase [bacterium HR34]
MKTANKEKIILAIETSCDETAIAVLKYKDAENFKILANVVSSQIKIHSKYGGVFPYLAKREHQKNLVKVLKEALAQAKLLKKDKTEYKEKQIEKLLEREQELKNELIKFLNKYSFPKIDFICVTSHPGLEPCLWVGVNFANALSRITSAKIIPINHIRAHIYSSLIYKFKKVLVLYKNKKLFPAISLVVSGGHTELYYLSDFLKEKLIGKTRDDAAGECFDKTSRLLGLPYPGGEKLSRLAKEFKGKSSITFPRPMINSKNFNFSFSGLKTAVLYKVKEFKKINENLKKELAKEIQQAIIDCLVVKTIKAVKEFKAKSLFLGGGVSANYLLRNEIKKIIKKEKLDCNIFLPEKNLTGDNALMIGFLGFLILTRSKVKLKNKVSVPDF